MMTQTSEVSPTTEISTGPALLELCERIEGRAGPAPVIRAGSTLDAREIVADGRVKAGTAPDLSGTVSPIMAEDPRDVLCGLFAVALAGGVPLVLPAPRPYESSASVRDRVSAAGEKTDARYAYLNGTWQELAEHAKRDVAHSDTAFLQFSSGSVGSPRPLRISHRAIRAQLGILTDTLAIGPDDVVGSWLPLSHDMGLVSALLALWLGGPLVLWSPEEFMMAPADWVGQLADHRVGFWPVIPVGLHVATNVLESRRHRLGALRGVLVGADVIRPKVLAEFESVVGCGPGVVRPCYGLADATLAVTCSPADRRWRTVRTPADSIHDSVHDGHPPELMSVGPPVCDTEVWIEVGGVPAGEEVIGDVVVRSASRCSGAIGGDVVSASVPLRTGDLGFVSDGELVFVGRSADVMRIAGEDFLPTEVEHLLVRSGFGKEGRVAVVGVDRDAVTRMIAVIENDSAAGDDGVAAACRQELLHAAREAALPLTEVRFVPRNWLSKTTSGKLRRRRIATDLMEEQS